MVQTHETREKEEEEEEEVSSIYGDILETILSFVPLVDLVSASRVSTAWRRAVYSSLTNFNKIKPWLFLHTQSKRSFEVKTTDAYDPRSNVWVTIHQPPIKYGSTIRSSTSTLLYHLSASNLSFSDDPFLSRWRHVEGPSIWRMDPIVALCGSHLVVAGSSWYFEDDPLAVEVYDLDSSTWRLCHSMPETLKLSAASTWLSVAANQSEMYVTEKSTGTTYSFDPIAGTWRGPYALRPDPRVFFLVVGFAGEDLVVASLIGDSSHPERLQICKVKRETMDSTPICNAPASILEKLMGNKETIHEIEISLANNLVYIYNSWDPQELVFCEFYGDGDKDCVWGSTRNMAWNDDVKIGGRLVFTCGRVDIGDLQDAMRSTNRKLVMNY